MKKIYSLLMALCLSAMMVNTNAEEKTLWNGTYVDCVELDAATVATFKAGDVLRVYVTVPESGANFKICYKGDSNGWSETAIPSIGEQWPWVNGGETYKEFTLTAADITALTGMNIYIYKGENSTITKVTLVTAEQGMSEKNLWNGTYVGGIELDAATVATFKADDVLRVYVTVPENGANFKICYKGESNGWLETAIPSIGEQWPWVNGGATYKEFTLTAADITALTGMNIYIYKGENSTITKVTLVTAGGNAAMENVWTDKVQSTKVIENGVLYIINNGIKYNVQGIRIE